MVLLYRLLVLYLTYTDLFSFEGLFFLLFSACLEVLLNFLDVIFVSIRGCGIIFMSVYLVYLWVYQFSSYLWFSFDCYAILLFYIIFWVRLSYLFYQFSLFFSYHFFPTRVPCGVELWGSFSLNDLHQFSLWDHTLGSSYIPFFLELLPMFQVQGVLLFLRVSPSAYALVFFWGVIFLSFFIAFISSFSSGFVFMHYLFLFMGDKLVVVGPVFLLSVSFLANSVLAVILFMGFLAVFPFPAVPQLIAFACHSFICLSLFVFVIDTFAFYAVISLYLFSDSFRSSFQCRIYSYCLH